MATYRTISLNFWSDRKVLDSFTPEDKFVFVYLLTNPQTNICGCYEVSQRQIELDTGYTWETAKKIILRMQNTLNVIRYDEQNGEILVLNWGKYNWSKSDKLLQSVLGVANTIKTTEFREYVEDAVTAKMNGEPQPVPPEIPYAYGTDTQQNQEQPVRRRARRERAEVTAVASDTDPVAEKHFSPAVETAVRNWLQYKKERREGYKPAGLKSLLNKVAGFVAEHGEAVLIANIDTAMANGWKGIQWEVPRTQVAGGNPWNRTQQISNRVNEVDSW